jgi:hypothetical protein
MLSLRRVCKQPVCTQVSLPKTCRMLSQQKALDAGDYAMFISGTWWETQTDVPAVEAVAEEQSMKNGNVVNCRSSGS